MLRTLAIVSAVSLASVVPLPASAQSPNVPAESVDLASLSVLGALLVGELVIDASHLVFEGSGRWIARDLVTGHPRRVMAALEVTLGSLESVFGALWLAWHREEPGDWQRTPAIAAPMLAIGVAHVVLGSIVLAAPITSDVTASIHGTAGGGVLSVDGTLPD
jgi:peptidoglycan/LPS O-acetylase OafA/YrhL